MFLMPKKVFVSGSYDLLHSGHVEFFKEASAYGDLYVGIGSDRTIQALKGHRTLYSAQERLFMVKAIRYVKDACINSGSGMMDFIPTVDALRPDMFVVNEDGSTPEKEAFCRERGIEYIVLKRLPSEGLEARSSTALKAKLGVPPQHLSGRTEPGSGQFARLLPTRLDLAGTWIDQPYVSCFAPGWAITISLEPTFEVRPRCGLATSTRNTIRRIWPVQLPNMDPEMLARLVFCFENEPERSDGIISGAQDAIGICVPGLVRHYYDAHFWPDKIESCRDEAVLGWLEDHLCMIPMFPRRPACSVVEGKDITKAKVEALTAAAADCWEAIMARDLAGFAAACKASFEAQLAMFPGMVNPSFPEGSAPVGEDARASADGFLPSVQAYIDKYSVLPGVLAWKISGAGGGGYLALVCSDRAHFPEDAIEIHIRRGGM